MRTEFIQVEGEIISEDGEQEVFLVKADNVLYVRAFCNDVEVLSGDPEFIEIGDKVRFDADPNEYRFDVSPERC